MLRASNWLIGGCFFIFLLAVSAFWEDDIRWLHFFQAWMYVATTAMALRRNRWGSFIGISAAGLWDYANLVATTFFFNGVEQLSLWMHAGHVARPDLLIAVPAWFYLLLPKKSFGDLGKFLPTFVLTTGFFALDMAIFRPRYLGLFPRMLHPRWPF